MLGALCQERESESEIEVIQSCPTLCNPIDCGLLGSSIRPWDFPGKSTGVGCHFLLQGDLPDPGIKPRSPAFQTDTLTPEPPGKPCQPPEQDAKPESEEALLHIPASANVT